MCLSLSHIYNMFIMALKLHLKGCYEILVLGKWFWFVLLFFFFLVSVFSALQVPWDYNLLKRKQEALWLHREVGACPFAGLQLGRERGLDQVSISLTFFLHLW